MSFSFKKLGLVVVKLCQSMLAHRQPPAPGHIGPYGGSFVNGHQDDKH
jgi:hypothetical protein